MDWKRMYGEDLVEYPDDAELETNGLNKSSESKRQS